MLLLWLPVVALGVKDKRVARNADTLPVLFRKKPVSPDDRPDDVRSRRTMGDCQTRELTAETGPARAAECLRGTLEGKAGVMDGLRTGMHKAIRQHRSKEMHRTLLRQQGEMQYALELA
ncbi:hypothetical protein llap_247 [Limosa lapponica baueri]|uniref:Uncharacterized protein n=1 Tax=Limosa lapponica baueri TaxID=1758121 RepID=A0A2I0UTL6_LIMLA|nr:hypothetical protein llap_247 [Limosa lapponica baueri]